MLHNLFIVNKAGGLIYHKVRFIGGVADLFWLWSDCFRSAH